MTRARFLLVLLSIVALAKDPLPSWNSGPAKQRILDFVKGVTKRGSPDFVPPAERFATFDNDGTLWAEQPIYFQFIYMVEAMKARAAHDPDYARRPNVALIVAEGMAGLDKLDIPTIADMFIEVQDGMTDEESQKWAKAWLDTAKHPRYNRLYRELIYQPQLELLKYLRSKDFQTYICSGGDLEIVRALAPVYGIAPEQIIATAPKYRYKSDGSGGRLIRLSDLLHVNDRDGKAVGIHFVLGRRPLLAFGNSDGDQQMLEYTTPSGRPALSLIVHHDDPEREFAYDRGSRIGALDTALDEASKRNWVVVSMKKDWKRIFPFEK